MSFPITHLRAADLVAREIQLTDAQAADFFLGALAPDGVHYRQGFFGVPKSVIGTAKKLSHLCRQSEEPWGQVTDNDGWVEEVVQFLRANTPDAFILGYAAHALTDLHNNKTIWTVYRTQFPADAARGYTGDYYRELAALDLQLYQEKETERVMDLLTHGTPRDVFNHKGELLVTAEEVSAIRASLFSENNAAYSTYINQPPPDTSANRLMTRARMNQFITEAAEFVCHVLHNR